MDEHRNNSWYPSKTSCLQTNSLLYHCAALCKFPVLGQTLFNCNKWHRNRYGHSLTKWQTSLKYTSVCTAERTLCLKCTQAWLRVLSLESNKLLLYTVYAFEHLPASWSLQHWTVAAARSTAVRVTMLPVTIDLETIASVSVAQSSNWWGAEDERQGRVSKTNHIVSGNHKYCNLIFVFLVMMKVGSKYTGGLTGIALLDIHRLSKPQHHHQHQTTKLSVRLGILQRGEKTLVLGIRPEAFQLNHGTGRC